MKRSTVYLTFSGVNRSPRIQLALSRELSDTSVYSLLEEMKRIVEKVRKEPWRMVESCTDLCQHSVGALT